MARKELINLQDAIALFLQSSEAELKSYKTVRGYEEALKLFLGFCGNIPLEDLNEDHLRSFILHEAARRREVNGEMVEYSTETIYERYKVVKTLVRWLHQRKYIPEDISRNAFILAVELLIPKNALPLSSMVTIIWLSGKSTIPIDDGGSTTTGSAILKEAVNIKNVTSRKAKSTIGVMSSAGAPPFDGFFDIFNSF